jgi:hypothetical protein
MEREIWTTLYRHVCFTAQEVHQKYVQIQPWIIVATMLWAALHDRTVSWACDPRNWSTTKLKPMRIPSETTMGRRVDSVATGLFWRRLQEHLRQSEPSLLAFLDGKPLPIGGNSKDREAGYGRAAGGFAKGYKLHTVWTNSNLPKVWEVTPMNVSEKTVAYRLISQLHDGGGYLLADGNYDASYLYDCAFEHGYQLVAPHRQAKKPGSGGHYQSPHRLRSIALLEHCYGQKLYQARGQIERDFGNATAFGGGLGPLPAWVRGSNRVRTWVWAKLLINAARILIHKDLHHP